MENCEMNHRNLLEVDWSKIPAPADDGAAAHLVGMTIPSVSLVATDDSSVTLSAQDNDYQAEMASRLHLPFPVLSDEKLALTRALDLPTMQVAGLTMIKRLALIVDDARITQVFYPVFPPDRNAGDVLAWLKENPV